jgi:hypothetical protein
MRLLVTFVLIFLGWFPASACVQAQTTTYIDLLSKGAVADAVWGITGCSVSSSLSEVTCPSITFTSADVVTPAKKIVVDDQGPSGTGPLVTTITGLCGGVSGDCVTIGTAPYSSQMLAHVTSLNAVNPGSGYKFNDVVDVTAGGAATVP